MSKTHRSFRTLGFTIVILAFASLAITASTSSGFAFLSEVSEMFGSAMPTAKGSRAVRSVAAPEATNIVVNYDFASAVTGTPCAASPLTTAAGVSSTFTTGGTGGGTCTTPGGIAASTGGTPPAFVSNAENQSVSLTSFAPGSSNFFQFQLSGVGNYSDYMLFFQSQRSGTGPLNADVQYSTNGTDFTTFQTVNLAAAFSGFNLDLSTVSAIEGQPTVYIRIRGSGGTGASGTFRVDNFQVQGTTIEPPTVTTNTVTNLSQTTATINGSANPNGNASIGWFRYDTTPIMTCDDTAGTRAPLTPDTGDDLGSAMETAFSEDLTGLTPDTDYFYCAIASNAGGKGFGTVVSFKTDAAVTLSINEVTKDEGNAGATLYTFTVTLSNAAPVGGVTFDISTMDGTSTDADNDHEPKTLTGQTIPEGQLTYEFVVTVNGDTTFEADEAFTVVVTNITGATGVKTTGTGTITNDDAAPDLTITDVSQAETNSGTTTFTFQVNLSAPAGPGGATFDIATVDGSAQDGGPMEDSDYVGQSLTGQSIPAGSSSYQFSVTVNGDTAIEASETFFVNVTNSTGATVSDGQGQGTIENDDNCTAPTAIVYVDDDWAGTIAGSDPDGVGGSATQFGCDSFATVQGGVTAVDSGGSVIVYAGTYLETQVLITRPMTVEGAGCGLSIIDSSDATSPSAGTVRIDLPVGTTGGVSFSGFTTQNPAVSGTNPSNRYHITARQQDAGPTIHVFENCMVGTVAGTPPDFAFWSYQPRGSVEFDHNTLTNNTSNPILIENPIGAAAATNVHDNTISGNASTAYFAMAYSGNDVTAQQRVANNTFNGALASAISFNGGFGGTTGKYTNVLIENNTITSIGAGTAAIGRRGISLSNGASAANQALGAIENAVVMGNIITGTGEAFSTGIRLVGLIVSPVITENDIRNLARGISGEVNTSTSPTGVEAHFNNIVDNATGFHWDGTADVDAENNWWGCNEGPLVGAPDCDTIGGTGAAAVDADPWIMLGVSASPTGVNVGESSTITADMTRNSAGETPAGGVIPNTPVTFEATGGTIEPPPNGTVENGTETATFTLTSPANGSACATVDHEQVCATVRYAFMTASEVSVSGRVVTADGRGVTNATVTLVDGAGNSRKVITGRRGAFEFVDVPTGSTYTLGVTSQRFTFDTQVIAVTDQVSGLTLTARRQ